MPSVIFHDREASQAIKAMTPITTGQGDWVSSRSEKIRNSRSGSNRRSSVSPYSREKDSESAIDEAPQAAELLGAHGGEFNQ